LKTIKIIIKITTLINNMGRGSGKTKQTITLVASQIKQLGNLFQKKINKSQETIIDSVGIIEKYTEMYVNRCVICGIDMGPNNPRQLCRKTYCENGYED
jgi:hypothetical protein